MPHYLEIGLTVQEFFHSTPKELRAYDKAFEEREKRKDYELWRQGCYNYIAVMTALYNAFRQKNMQPEEYLEAPFHVIDRMNKINAGLIEMSEEEKEYWRNKLFGQLEDMQRSFEATHDK